MHNLCTIWTPSIWPIPDDLPSTVQVFRQAVEEPFELAFFLKIVLH